MNTAAWSSIGLRLHLACRRAGWTNVVICLAGVVALSLTAWWLPHARDGLILRQQALRAAERELHAPLKTDPNDRITPNAQRLDALYRALGEHRYAEQQVKTLFAVAAKNNLVLMQADYRSAYDKAGKFHTYQIVLPVKGSYAAIRAFCEQVLLAIPFASLDQVNFKRDAIASNTIEAQLHLTLYLADPAPDSAARISQSGDVE
jgi:hypothetical protein